MARASGASEADSSLQPWQFFVLAALACATAAVLLARGQSLATLLLLSILMGTTALVGLAALRMLRPLVSSEETRIARLDHRTKATLEREKLLTLRSIKELEFDRAMGKLADRDWEEMSQRLRTRATRIMRDLEAEAGYREKVERDLASRLGDALTRTAPETASRQCAGCSTSNDPDARFCKNCGKMLKDA